MGGATGPRTSDHEERPVRQPRPHTPLLAEQHDGTTHLGLANVDPARGLQRDLAPQPMTGSGMDHIETQLISGCRKTGH